LRTAAGLRRIVSLAAMSESRHFTTGSTSILEVLNLEVLRLDIEVESLHKEEERTGERTNSQSLMFRPSNALKVSKILIN